MKLSPPASSSDLETAREIARRLQQRRRRQDRPGPVDQPAAPRPAAPFAAPPPRPSRVTPPPPAFEVPLEPPSWDAPASEATRLDDAGDPLAGFGEPALAADFVTDAGEPTLEVEVESPGVSPEEMVGSAEPPPLVETPEPEPGPYGALPFELDLDETGAAAADGYDAPAPPSWDDIVEACLELAQASGAMLVDPSGQVFAARGEWPEPGPDAIAAKLVSTMERALRDAPTRSISAPLMGRHLTAWRVPLAEGLVTAAFLGKAPVRAEARPAIDTEIHRGAGA